MNTTVYNTGDPDSDSKDPGFKPGKCDQRGVILPDTDI